MLIMCFVSGSISPIKSNIEIGTIKVYYFSFLISPFGSSTVSDMRTGKGFWIENELRIEKIEKELLKLTPIEEDFFETQVHLVCDVYNNDGEKEFTLLCDKFRIKIGDTVYKMNYDLINLLIK